MTVTGLIPLALTLVRWGIGCFLLVTASMPHLSPIFWEPEDDRHLHARSAIAIALFITLAALTIPLPSRPGVRLLLGAAATVVHLTIWYARWG